MDLSRLSGRVEYLDAGRAEPFCFCYGCSFGGLMPGWVVRCSDFMKVS